MKSKSSKGQPKPVSTGKQQEAASGAGGPYGESNYAATRQYNEGLKKHVEEHDIERDARDAAPKSAAEEKEMQDAEREGRSRSKGGEDSLNGPDGGE